MTNREIKFRAWEKNTNQMMKVYNVIHCEGGLRVEGTGVHIGNGWVTQENGYKHNCDAILMQYTGLKDKNGVEIYEGDVVKFNFTGREEGTSEVKWEYGEWNVTDFSEDVRISDNLYGAAYIEVMGNIHQNPELLK